MQSFWTRDQTHVSCIGRQILIHCTAREVPGAAFDLSVDRVEGLEPNLTIHLQFLDLRVAVLGNVDSGKSTLLGVLTQGELDNGRGRARLNLFRHLHEIQSGRTSSISFEILGFNSKGEVHAINGTQWDQTLRMGW